MHRVDSFSDGGSGRWRENNPWLRSYPIDGYRRHLEPEFIPELDKVGLDFGLPCIPLLGWHLIWLGQPLRHFNAVGWDQ